MLDHLVLLKGTLIRRNTNPLYFLLEQQKHSDGDIPIDMYVLICKMLWRAKGKRVIQEYANDRYHFGINETAGEVLVLSRSTTKKPVFWIQSSISRIDAVRGLYASCVHTHIRDVCIHLAEGDKEIQLDINEREFTLAAV